MSGAPAEQIAYLLERSPFYREKLAGADVGGPLEALPLTTKQELRATVSPEFPMGTHVCVERPEIARIYSTSGTTGAPSYIPLTAGDVDNWVTGSARSYALSGVAAGDTIVSTYNAGPFAAGAALAAFDRIGLCHVPVGTGNTERLVGAIQALHADAVVMTPSYAAYALEWAAARGIDLAASSVRRVLVAGEPGGGEAAFRARLEAGWGARVTEAMGIGDIGVSLWGECEAQDGMHLGAAGFVLPELIDPGTGTAIALEDGAEGELVLSHLRHRAAPLLRFRTRDHVRVRAGVCACGREGSGSAASAGRTTCSSCAASTSSPRRCARSWPGSRRAPAGRSRCVRGVAGPKQEPPLRVAVELGEAEPGPGDAALAAAIRDRIRAALVVQTAIELVPFGSLQRSEYKSKLVAPPG